MNRPAARNVKTYIASGNVVFTSRLGAKALAAKLQEAIKEEFGISIAIVVLTAKQLATAIQRNPFAGASPNSLYVAFATGPITKADVDRLANLDIAPEDVRVRGRLIYLHMPNGYGRARLPGEVSRVKVPTTVRNWRTVVTLSEMAAAPLTISR